MGRRLIHQGYILDSISRTYRLAVKNEYPNTSHYLQTGPIGSLNPRTGFFSLYDDVQPQARYTGRDFTACLNMNHGTVTEFVNE